MTKTFKRFAEWKKANPDEFDKILADVCIVLAFAFIAAMATCASNSI